MTVRQIKGAWWVDFRIDHKRIRRKSPVNTKRYALEYERKLQEKLLIGAPETMEVVKKEKKCPKMSEFAKDFLSIYAKANNKPSEVETKEATFKNHLLPFFGNLSLEEVNNRHIEGYKAKKLEAGLSPKSVNNHLTMLRKMLSVAVDWQTIEHIPVFKWLKVPEQKFDFLDFDEAVRLTTSARGMWKVMITLGLKTGLRQGELIGLRWEDVDLVAKKLMVRQAVARGIVGTPKSGKSREIPLSDQTVELLKEFRHLRGELVFSDENGKMLKKGACKWPLWSACQKAGLRRIGWHVLRHSFASHLVMRGVPLKAVQELLGHSTIEMTMRYSHLAPAVHQEAIAILESGKNFGHYMGIDAQNKAAESVSG